MEFFIWVCLALLVLCSILVVAGKSIWIRLLGFSLIATIVLIIIVLYASLQEQTFLLDLAIIYALSSFIGMIFITLFALERANGKKETKWKP